MKSILNYVLIILIINILFYNKKSIATTPSNYYYFYYDEEAKELKTKAFTSDSNADDFKLAAKWESYGDIYIKGYVTAENEWGDFPDYTYSPEWNWDSYVSEFDAEFNFSGWKTTPSPAWIYVDGSKSESEAIFIKFYNGWGYDQRELSAYTYRCVVKNGDEYFFKYKKSGSVKDPYTMILMNSSPDFHAETVEDGFGNEHTVEWTLNENPMYYQLHVRSVIRHEMGHALGLAHNDDDPEWNGSIMHSEYVVSTENEVTYNDRAALQYLNDRSIPSASNGINETLSDDFYISSNYPNPFNSSTIIDYFLPEKMDLEISIYNILGQKVRTLFKGSKEDGLNKISWDGRNDNCISVTSGAYLFKIRSLRAIKSKKLLLLR